MNIKKHQHYYLLIDKLESGSLLIYSERENFFLSITKLLLPSCSGREWVQQGVRLHPVQQRGGATDRHDQHERHVRPGGEAH